MADSIKLWRAWRKRANQPLLRTTLLFVLALLTTVGTITASIFSSFVVDSSNLVVLVNSPYCGAPEPERLLGRGSYVSKVGEIASKYGPECYQDLESMNQTAPRACGAFTDRNISFSATVSKVCPFHEGMCIAGSRGTSVSMYSPLLGTNTDLGMNPPAGNGVQYRQNTMCAVLLLEGRTQQRNVLSMFMAFGRAPYIPGEQAVSIHHGSTDPEGGGLSMQYKLAVS
jgi:hypothetical protein